MSEETLNGGCSGDCGSCGSDCDTSQATVTLTMDDNTELTCAVIAVFPAQDKEYIALLPLDENGENNDGEVFIYRFHTDENNNPELENIESDEEYEIVSDAFDEWLDEAQFEEENGSEE
ncbi:MAG: DUF1292 domain-containing protein [Lachnospiraceae bacterium]|nr:DUF1292 domain-containing protein [Lachnospiraceae bacterium]MDD3614606.1 DUF1292 domain-containing protein [Lachnospiraceae bacterium]